MALRDVAKTFIQKPLPAWEADYAYWSGSFCSTGPSLQEEQSPSIDVA